MMLVKTKGWSRFRERTRAEAALACPATVLSEFPSPVQQRQICLKRPGFNCSFVTVWIYQLIWDKLSRRFHAEAKQALSLRIRQYASVPSARMTGHIA